MFLRLPPRRRALIAAALGAAAVAAVVGIVLSGGDDDEGAAPAVHANDVSKRATACLAADSATASGGDLFGRVWSAMQTAGAQHDRNVQQLVVPAAGAEQAGPYLSGLVAQRCDLIVTVGAPFGRASTGVAQASPAVRLTAVDSTLGSAPTNVTLVTGAEAEGRVAEQVGGLRPRT
ncbi:hypothetical protein [Streptomyces sp. NRRL WC-3742]|uniref:hypothetical protein n=1 Tax=Streptomyces sp. NRRL WC-3742 TaxID=1463934 RepID=UPI0004CA5B0F|nr:hypothetical protein [Streptomyces sp. NRRL WC-3742]